MGSKYIHTQRFWVRITLAHAYTYTLASIVPWPWPGLQPVAQQLAHIAILTTEQNVKMKKTNKSTHKKEVKLSGDQCNRTRTFSYKRLISSLVVFFFILQRKYVHRTKRIAQIVTMNFFYPLKNKKRKKKRSSKQNVHGFFLHLRICECFMHLKSLSIQPKLNSSLHFQWTQWKPNCKCSNEQNIRSSFSIVFCFHFTSIFYTQIGFTS